MRGACPRLARVNPVDTRTRNHVIDHHRLLLQTCSRFAFLMRHPILYAGAFNTISVIVRARCRLGVQSDPTLAGIKILWFGADIINVEAESKLIGPLIVR